MTTAPRIVFAALRFDGVETPWLWLLGILAAVGILVATYRGIFLRSERRLTWLLMGLRGAGLIALLLALTKPTWTREKAQVDAGQIAIVLDNSRSMSFSDPGGKTRYALAKDAAARLRRAFVTGSPALEVEFFDINGVSLKDIPEQPQGERTDLARSLTDSAKQLRAKYLTGMVLISDGMDTTRRQDFSELGDLPAPVHTIGFRADEKGGDLDLALRRPKAPERALVNNEIKVEVPVAKLGGGAIEATVVIKLGLERIASQTVSFAGGNSEQLVSVNMTPKKPGHFVFTATVETEAGEKTLANNSRHFPLRVDKEPIRVLYLEGFLRYEYKFLKARLEDDPDISLVTVVRRANPERIEAKGGKELVTPERLKSFDIVILGDMEASYLSANEYQTIVKWLDDKGHALLVLGGYHSFGPDGFRTTPLAEALPVVFAEKPPYQSEERFRMELTEEGKRHPILEVAGDRVKSDEAWTRTEPLLGMSVVQRAKPGAIVLAVNTNPSVAVDGKPAVVLATQRFGAGHTLVLTADTTWRWSRLPRLQGQSDTLYSRFWSQTMRWLAGRKLDDERPLLAVNTDKPDYDVAKPVSIRVVRQPRPDADLAGAEPGVEITDPAGKAVPIEMKGSSAEPDVFTGSFYPASGGRYQVAATLRSGGELLGNQASEFLVHGSELELENTGTNPGNLKAISNLTGGQYVDIEDADKLADFVTRKERRIVSERKTEFWNSPVLFLCFIGAVASEWFIRRRNHLV